MGEKRDTDMMHTDELKNDEYGHCGECHEVHQTSKMVEVDGYLYCKKCANPPARSIGEMHRQSAARIAALEAENAKLRAALKKTLDTLRIYSYTEYLDAREAREALEAK